jgi:PAS domain S-box-containing protein
MHQASNMAFFYFSSRDLQAGLLVSLLSVWVLVGLFAYLNRYTRRRYFTIWTGAWLFYALWLTLNMTFREMDQAPLISMLKQWCVSASAVFLLWGSVRFLGRRVRQTLLALFLGFLLVWSYVGAFYLEQRLHFLVPIFSLIGAASGVTAAGFWQYRRRRENMGAALLSMGFLMWGAYLLAYPWVQLSEELVSTGFFISAVLQLFIAVSMIILVLEQLRFVHQRRALGKIHQQQVEKAVLRYRVISTEERYRNLFTQASEAIVLAAVEDLRLLEANQSAQRLLGMQDTDVGRLSLTMFVQLSSSRDRPPGSGEEWFRYLCSQTPLVMVRKNGELLTAEANGSIIDWEGQPAYQFFLKELTDQSRLEHQLQQAEKYSSLGLMISGVAHELNNPLSVINGYLELILIHHSLPAATRTAVEKVVAESARATRLVRNFLSFAREQPGQRRMLNLNDYVQRLVELRKFDFSVSNIHLTLALESGLPETMADPDQVQQVLVNLVNNSFQAMIDVPGPHHLRLQTRSQEKLIQILVEDNGPGVPKDLESRVFEPLFTTKKPGLGTGLGLSITHSIMAEHQGRVFYQKSSLDGACFVLEFPVVAPVPIDSTGEGLLSVTGTDVSAMPGIVASILVIDDEASVANLLGEALEAMGHKATVCFGGRQALGLIAERSFDLVITDIRMPDVDGREFLAQALRKHPELAQRIVLFTGDVVNAETQAFLKSSNYPYITKPLELKRIKQVVGEILKRSGPAQAA